MAEQVRGIDQPRFDPIRQGGAAHEKATWPKKVFIGSPVSIVPQVDTAEIGEIWSGPIRASWIIPDNLRELVLMVDGVTFATITRWVDKKSGDHSWWAVERFSDQKSLGLFSLLSDACRIACVTAHVNLSPPIELIREWDEALSRPAPTAAEAPASLEARMGDLLDDIFHAVLLTVRDTLNDREVELKLGSFRLDLSTRICALLEEAGR